MDSKRKFFVYFSKLLKNGLEILKKRGKTNKIVSNFGNLDSVISILLRFLTFLQKLIYSDSFFPIRLIFLALILLVEAIAATFVAHRILSFLLKVHDGQGQSYSDMSRGEIFLLSFLLFLTFLGAAIAALFVVQKLVRYSLYFFLRIFQKIVRNPIGAGLFCGFMTPANLGYFFYLFLVPRFFFDNYEDSFFFEHHQKRVGAMSSFVTGQFLKFAWFYHRSLYEALFQRNWILLLFLGFFILQLVWTRLTIVRNWRFLYPNDKRKRVVRRVLLLQLEFMANFFLQFAPYDSYIEQPDSMVSRLVDSYLKDKGKKIFFLRSNFVGWLIGHIFFMILYIKLFGLIVAWIHAYIEYYNSRGSKGHYDDF